MNFRSKVDGIGKVMLKKFFTRYAVMAFFTTIMIPVVCFFLLYLLNLLPFRLPEQTYFFLIPIAPPLIGWLLATKAPLPDSLFARLFPLLLPLLLLPLAYIPGAWTGMPVGGGIFVGIMLLGASFLYGCFYLAFLVRSELRRRSTSKARGVAYLTGAVMASLVLATALHFAAARDLIKPGDKEASIGHGINIWLYMPFSENNLLVKPASPASLRIESNHPRLDGAIAALPVYAAVVQAVYVGLNKYEVRKIVACSNTPHAYKRLVDNETDIFFGVPPSREQREYAASKGLTFTETPIGREAFVFFVHKDNPVRSLSQAQIRDIYSGRVRNWKNLGGSDEAILPFQRPEGSGSQTAILRIMEGDALIKPLREHRVAGMGDIIVCVAEYRNRANAVGYSFRWYAAVLFANPNIRLLAVDGVEPTPENIKNGAYPFITPLLAVTARPLSAESQKLLDWITGAQGQDLLEQVGYVPL